MSGTFFCVPRGIRHTFKEIEVAIQVIEAGIDGDQSAALYTLLSPSASMTQSETKMLLLKRSFSSPKRTRSDDESETLLQNLLRNIRSREVLLSFYSRKNLLHRKADISANLSLSYVSGNSL